MSSDSVTAIYQFRQAAADLATSGQPTEEQLRSIAAAGYQVVINLALHDDPRYSLTDEESCVNALRMEYIHIPVQFAHPTQADLDQFFAAMDACKSGRVWVHCAANMRVSAFLGLYRLRDGWNETDAFSLMNEIWQPNEVWSAFIAERR